MQCPNPSCQSEHPKPELMMSERSGIEIDYCPRCRGIWLDRGELDKLLEKAAKEFESAPPPPRESQPPRDSYDGRPQYDSKAQYGDRHYKKHDYDKYRHSGGYKKKSLLSELFDF
jgi:Zn-finger nucleic acid-binding protein